MDNLRLECVWLEDWVVIDYLKNIREITKTKHYELLIALVLNKFCERQWGTKCSIGLEIKNKHSKDVSNNGLATLQELDEIITKKVEEDTSIDIMIGRKTLKKEKNITQGMAFQLKRFGINKKYQGANELMNSLNSYSKKYHKSEISLVVIIESLEKFDLNKIALAIQTNNYPFQKIIFIGISQNKVNFYGIWPEMGWSVFNLKTMAFDF